MHTDSFLSLVIYLVLCFSMYCNTGFIHAGNPCQHDTMAINILAIAAMSISTEQYRQFTMLIATLSIATMAIASVN